MSQLNTSHEFRKYKLSPNDVLALNKIEVQDKPRYYTTCPECSAKRKPIHQKLKCLGVSRPDPGRVYWGCNHCGWTGPGPQRMGRRTTPPRAKPAPPEPKIPITTTTRTLYNYSDHLRKVKVVRPDGEKIIWWEFKGPGGFWRKGTNGTNTERLLYRLTTAKKMARLFKLPICIVEGEKDVECLMHHGFPATCNAHGASEPHRASKWYQAHSDQLVGCDIAVFNDNDPAGLAHSEAICVASHRRARSIVVVDQATHFPGAKDITAWFKAGGDKDTLRDFIEGAPAYED
jgi:hypothetical protein